MKRPDILTEPPQHRSFLVRCWQEHSVHAERETVIWRFSLQNLRTDQRQGFATLEALLLSLEAELADAPVH
jgi:hypothetical protein